MTCTVLAKILLYKLFDIGFLAPGVFYPQLLSNGMVSLIQALHARGVYPNRRVIVVLLL